MISESIDHFRKRRKLTLTDMTIEDASWKLTERQFIAWKHAILDGRSNVEISDMMSTADTIIFPSEVQELLNGAMRRGFRIPGEPYPAIRVYKRAKAAA